MALYWRKSRKQFFRMVPPPDPTGEGTPGPLPRRRWVRSSHRTPPPGNTWRRLGQPDPLLGSPVRRRKTPSLSASPLLPGGRVWRFGPGKDAPFAPVRTLSLRAAACTTFDMEADRQTTHDLDASVQTTFSQGASL